MKSGHLSAAAETTDMEYQPLRGGVTDESCELLGPTGAICVDLIDGAEGLFDRVQPRRKQRIGEDELQDPSYLLGGDQKDLRPMLVQNPLALDKCMQARGVHESDLGGIQDGRFRPLVSDGLELLAHEPGR